VAKKGESSGKAPKRKPTKAQELAGDPLYVELGEIGRVHQPLDLANLVSRKVLCECKEVKRRTRPADDPEAVAKHAIASIKAAVAGLRPKTDQLIGQAVFGLGKFNNLSVGTRKTTLTEDPYNVSEDIYADRRPYVVGKVMVYLRSTPVTSTLDDPPEKVSQDDARSEGVAMLRMLAHAALTLHYSALLSLLVPEFDQKYDLEDSAYRSLQIDRAGLRGALDICSKYLFDSFLLFHLVAEFVLRDDEALAELPDSASEELVCIHQICVRCVPPKITITLERSVVSSYLFHEFPKFGEQSGDGAAISVLYYDHWYPWYQKQLPFDPYVLLAPSQSATQLLAGESAAFENSIRQSCDYEWPVVSEARRIAHRHLLDIYSVDEWKPEFAGQSLHQQADTFFDYMGGVLAKTVT
jgi:hypothetical protein